MCIYTYICTYHYVYIYIYREREREIDIYTFCRCGGLPRWASPCAGAEGGWFGGGLVGWWVGYKAWPQRKALALSRDCRGHVQCEVLI